jgi:hypothetical protein
VDGRITHICTITFKADKSIKEPEMMNYILGITKAMDVEAIGFEWHKKESKE